MPLPTSDAGIHQGRKRTTWRSTHHVGVPNKYSSLDTTDRHQVEGSQQADVEFFLQIWFSKLRMYKRGICIRGKNSLLYNGLHYK